MAHVALFFCLCVGDHLLAGRFLHGLSGQERAGYRATQNALLLSDSALCSLRDGWLAGRSRFTLRYPFGIFGRRIALSPPAEQVLIPCHEHAHDTG